MYRTFIMGIVLAGLFSLLGSAAIDQDDGPVPKEIQALREEIRQLREAIEGMARGNAARIKQLEEEIVRLQAHLEEQVLSGEEDGLDLLLEGLGDEDQEGDLDALLGNLDAGLSEHESRYQCYR